MIALSRTDLTPEEKVYLATAAVAMKGTPGAFNRLAEQFGVTSPTLYAVGRETQQVLGEQFEPHAAKPAVLWVRVDRRQLERASIAMRAVAPASGPNIEELLPIVYPGIKLGYGSLHALLAGAEDNAALFNASVPLDSIEAIAADEMFLHGQPVLDAMDLRTGFVALLRLAKGRGAQDWKEVLQEAQEEGLHPRVVVKDAAQGLAAAVTEVFPEVEQRDDCFHAAYEMGKVHTRLERSAYAAIKQEDKAARELGKQRQGGGGDLRPAAQKLRRAEEHCRRAVELFDSFEQAQRSVLEALEPVDVRTMMLREPLRMQRALLEGAARLRRLPNRDCRKVGGYIKNRTPGLILYCAEMHQAFLALEPHWPMGAVCHAAVLWQAAALLHHGRQRWARDAQVHAFELAWQELRALMPAERVGQLLGAIEQLYRRRYRASSAIEGFHAGLRPHLYVHKSVSQGFLELHRAYRNLRTARRGPRKGTSAYERLTGNPVADWLSMLGYPPSRSAIQN